MCFLGEENDHLKVSFQDLFSIFEVDLYIYSSFLLLKYLNKCDLSSIPFVFIKWAVCFVCVFFNKWLYMNNKCIIFVKLE